MFSSSTQTEHLLLTQVQVIFTDKKAAGQANPFAD